MTRINQVDQVLLLLRQQLQRMSKAQRRPQAAKAGTPSAIRRAAALTQIEGLSPDDLEQSLIRALLTEEFGDSLASDARFQKVITDVYRIIAAAPETHQLLRQAVEQLKQPGTR